MAGPSVGRRALMAKAQGWAANALRGLPGPILTLGGAPVWKDACAKAPACIAQPPSTGAVGPYSHLESDGPRGAWLTAVDGFLRSRQAERLSRQGLSPGHAE
jgi:hypothetical protein